MNAKRHSFLHTLSQSLLTGAFFAISATAQAAGKVEDWVKLLPETAVVVISIKDTPELVKDWDSSGAGRFMEDEAVKRWMAPMYKDGEPAWDKFFKEGTGESLRDALSLYSGAAVAGFILESPEDFESDDTRLVAISDIAGNEAKLAESRAKQLEAYKKDEYPDAVLKSKEIDGVQVSYISDGDDEDAWWIEAWAVVNGLLLEASDEELITDLIARVKATQGDHPAAAHFARLAEMRGSEADITVYGHLDPVFEMLKESLEEDAGDAPSPITPKAIFDALGVNELHAVAACIEINDQHARGDLVLFHDEKPQGIFPALLRGTSTEVPQLAFIPADVDAASVNRASPGNIYDTIFKSLAKLGPMAMMLTGQLEGLEKQAGISIRNDLLGSLDDVYLEMTKFSQNAESSLPEQNQISAFKLKNRDRFQSSFDALWKLIGNGFGVFEETEYEGHKIFMMKPSLSGGPKTAGAPSLNFGYVITDEYVFLVQGAPDLLHKVLGRLKNSPAGTSLWDQPQSQVALAALPKGFTAMSVSNGSAILRTIFTTMSHAQSMVPTAKTGEKSARKGPKSKPGATAEEDEEEGEDAEEGMFDPDAAPPDEIFDRYFGVGASAMYPLPGATQFIYISQPAEKK
jgi:hypothetical protein